MKLRLITTLLFSLLLCTVGCKSDNNKGTSDVAPPVAPKAEESNDPSQGEDAQKDSAPAADYYTTIPFGRLNSDQRTLFVKVAKAELCPCDGSLVSLDECLRKKEDACDIALSAAAVAMQAIRNGNNETDTLSQMTDAVAAMKKEYQFDLEGRPYKGAKDAKVVVVEFADFQCPFCKRTAETIHQLADDYKGKSVAFYFKQFPLPSHPYGFQAASASIAALKQGKFWEMHDLIFENQSSLSDNSFNQFASKLGLNLNKFKKDAVSDETKAFVNADRTDGENADIKGTPSIYINGRQYTQSYDNIDAFKQKIDSLLEK